MSARIALVRKAEDSVERERGGVDFLDEAIARIANEGNFTVSEIPLFVDPSRISVRGDETLVLFVQQEGRLSARYHEWARQVLEQGAFMVEQNVFALASRFRPEHPRYLHAFYAEDGAYRFAWRSFASGLPAPSRYVILPLPVRDDVAVVPRTVRSPDRLRLLRVGRNTTVKWSAWEQRLAIALAAALPGIQFELTLVGVPDQLLVPVPDNVGNLDVRVRDYAAADDLALLYADADVYLHHSRIGETYGSTLAEAQRAGCYCVCGLQAEWDSAPMEFLDPATSWVGTPRRALKDPVSTIADLLGGPTGRQSRRSVRFRRATITPSRHAELMVAAAAENEGVETLPSAAAALDYLASTGHELGTVMDGIRGPMVEAARAVRRRSDSTLGH